MIDFNSQLESFTTRELMELLRLIRQIQQITHEEETPER